VIARTSSFSFKDRNVDVHAIAEQLHATHVLEGSVRRAGKQVRITAQLIDASDSTHVWSRSYDRELTAANLFQIQSENGRSPRIAARRFEPIMPGAPITERAPQGGPFCYWCVYRCDEDSVRQNRAAILDAAGAPKG